MTDRTYPKGCFFSVGRRHCRSDSQAQAGSLGGGSVPAPISRERPTLGPFPIQSSKYFPGPGHFLSFLSRFILPHLPQ